MRVSQSHLFIICIVAAFLNTITPFLPPSPKVKAIIELAGRGRERPAYTQLHSNRSIVPSFSFFVVVYIKNGELTLHAQRA